MENKGNSAKGLMNAWFIYMWVWVMYTTKTEKYMDWFNGGTGCVYGVKISAARGQTKK